MKYFGALIALILALVSPLLIVAITPLLIVYVLARYCVYPLIVTFIWVFTHFIVYLKLRGHANNPFKFKSTPWEIFQGK